MKDFLHHLFVPRVSNNHRARLLHHSILFVFIAVLFVAEIGFITVKSRFPQVLGAAINLSAQELLQLTNQKREKEGLSQLTLNDELSQAAAMKAKDMFEKNYWAHTATDGKTPWHFIENAGYVYVYAGENLAKGFTTSEDAVDAWMASPTHRDNMLSSNYSDIGFAIEKGQLQGEETILVVEMFGSKTKPVYAGGLPKSQPSELVPVQSDSSVIGAQILQLPLINSIALSKHLVEIILFFFIFALVVDMIVIKRKNLARIVGHNIDHIFFLSTIMLLVIFFRYGSII